MYSTKQIKELEQLATTDAKISEWELMQRAGAEGFELLTLKYKKAKKIVIFCGSGNNAGDGYVLAAKAKKAGKEVDCFYLNDPKTLKQPALTAYQQAMKVGVNIQPFHKEVVLQDYEVIIDALLGTGFKGKLRPDFFQAISIINATNIAVIALDVPSGLNADTGCVDEIAIVANQTLTFIGYKTGLFTADAADYCGEVFVSDLEIPEEFFAKITPLAEFMNLDSLCNQYLLPRKHNSHKGHYGYVAVIGGDIGMSGAVRMAAEAAARAGAGLTSAYTQPENVAVITTARPEIMGYPLKDPSDLSTLLDRASVIAVGPGLGRGVWGETCFKLAMAQDKPTVIDADGLWFLAKNPQKCPNAILTPHPKEAAMLLNSSTEAVQENRFAAIAQLQQQYGGVIVLKGSGTLVYDGRSSIYVSQFGNPGMASGGMGDVLTGLIAGLLAQHIPLLAAACLGVCLHGEAANLSAKDDGMRGMLALDLLPYIRCLVN